MTSETLRDYIYSKIKEILHKKNRGLLKKVEFNLSYQRDLAFDSLEMFELISEFEKEFNIIIDQDDIDKFIFQPQSIKYIGDIKQITIYDSVNYIHKKMISNSKPNFFLGNKDLDDYKKSIKQKKDI